MSYLLKIFGTGQLTLPKVWRQTLGTEHFDAELRGKEIVLRPVQVFRAPPHGLTARKLRSDLSVAGYGDAFAASVARGLARSSLAKTSKKHG
jgi:hypothetical protein